MSEPKPQFTPSDALVTEVGDAIHEALCRMHATRRTAATAAIDASGLGECVEALETSTRLLKRHLPELLGHSYSEMDACIEANKAALANVRGPDKAPGEG